MHENCCIIEIGAESLHILQLKQIPVTVRSTAQVSGRSNAGVLGSNLAESIGIRLVFFV